MIWSIFVKEETKKKKEKRKKKEAQHHTSLNLCLSKPLYDNLGYSLLQTGLYWFLGDQPLPMPPTVPVQCTAAVLLLLF